MHQLKAVTARDRLKARYVQFCKNPLRDEKALAAEFEQLALLPKVTHIALRDPHTLMVGTSVISITEPKTDVVYDVGEFIIYLYRQRQGRIWDTGFYFQNINGTVDGYHHPHINVRDVPGFGELGLLCIQRGQFHIYQHLRSGEMHFAVSLLIDVLQTYDGKGIYRPVEMWPRRRT